MAAWFDRASSKGLDLLASPLSTFPISAGCWFNLPALVAGNQCILTASQAPSLNYCTVYVDSAGTITTEKTGGGTATNGTYAVGEWFYLLMRLISATSIRTSTLNGKTGLIAHANNTSAGAMTSFDTFSIGDFRITGNNTNFITGGVGESFLTNNDCYSSGGQQADNSFIKQLAYQGPLSVPRIRDQLIDYRTLRGSPEGGHGEDIVDGFRGRQIWTNQNTVLNGPHPPLPPGYTKVRPARSLVVV